MGNWGKNILEKLKLATVMVPGIFYSSSPVLQRFLLQFFVISVILARYHILFFPVLQRFLLDLSSFSTFLYGVCNNFFSNSPVFEQLSLLSSALQ